MPKQRSVFNVTTGRQELVDLTQSELDELAALAAQTAATEAARLAAIPDYGGDDTPAEQVKAGVIQLRQYLNLAAPTNAQTIGAVKLTIRLALFLLRRQLG